MYDPNSLAICARVVEVLRTDFAGSDATVVDRGCGGGRLLEKLVAMDFHDSCHK